MSEPIEASETEEEGEAMAEAPPADFGAESAARPSVNESQPPPETGGAHRDSKAGNQEERKNSMGARKSLKPNQDEGPQPQQEQRKKSMDKSKRRGSMFDEIEGAKAGGTGGGKAADNLAKDLAGTLQSFFTQEEKTNDSTALKPLRRPKHIFENTFRLQAYNPFSRDRVQKVLDSTLAELVEPLKSYNSETANDIATKIAEKIRARVLALRFDRYKIVVMTNIGPLNRQGLHIGFRCLWDSDKDSYATSSHKTTNVFCSAVVYGIYYE